MNDNTNNTKLVPVDNIEDVMNIVEVHDWIIPVRTAAKLLGLTRGGLYEAINKGDIVRVNGVTYESVRGYRVDKKKQIAAKIGQYYKGQGQLIEGIVINGGELKGCVGNTHAIVIQEGVNGSKGIGDCYCGEVGKLVKELAKKGIKEEEKGKEVSDE